MSKWRCEVDISFPSESDAVSFLNLLRDIQPKIYKGTEKVLPVYEGDEATGKILVSPGVIGDGIPTIAKCRYHECFHDENPPKPCGNYKNFDLKSPIIEPILTKDGIEMSALDIVAEKVDSVVSEAVAIAITEERAAVEAAKLVEPK